MTRAPKSRWAGAFAALRAARRVSRAITMTRSSPTARSRRSFFTRGGEVRGELEQADRVGLGRHQRGAGSDQVGAHRGRGEIPPRRAPAPVRAVHAAELQGRRLALRGRRAGRDLAPDRRGRRPARHPRGTAPLHHAERLARRALRIVAQLEGRAQPVAVEPRPGDRRIVRQRPARGDAGVRDRRSVARSRTQPGDRGERAPHAPGRCAHR